MHENREISWTSWSKDQDRSVKVISRTADVHVQEKSDCAIVPMNQPNNEDLSSGGGWGGKGVDQGEPSFDLTRSRHSAGVRVSHGSGDVRRVSFAATIQGKSRMR
jgi:hypothetical protein